MDGRTYVSIALIVIAILVFILYVAWQIKKNGLRKVAVSLIVYAEENFMHNKDKFNYCVAQLIKLIPAPYSFFVTNEMVEAFVQNTFDMCKKALDYREEK